MAITAEKLAARLKAARKAARISQSRVSRALRIPRTAVTQLENGKRAVSTLELYRMSLLYCRSISSFFEET